MVLPFLVERRKRPVTFEVTGLTSFELKIQVEAKGTILFWQSVFADLDQLSQDRRLTLLLVLGLPSQGRKI
jgi:hypothetical protein